jgi:hypothetical protein
MSGWICYFPPTWGINASPQCHDDVTTRLKYVGTSRHGRGSISQLNGIFGTGGHAAACLWVDWWSSGRRFKSCQPDQEK